MVFLYICLGLLVVTLLTSFILYRMTLYNKPTRRLDPLDMPTEEHLKHLRDAELEMTLGWIRENLDLPYEKVGITSYDGLKLAGRYYDFAEGAPVVMMFHGYKGDGPADFRGIFRMVRSLGYNILLVTERAHCDSEGRTITLGIREKFDCRDWVKFAEEKFGSDRPLALYGASMGAATVLMTSGFELPENVRCIVADCGFTTPKAIMMKILRELKLPFIYPFVRLGALLFGGIRITDEGAPQALAKNTRPILFIHGEADNFVPCDMSRENYAAAVSEKKLVTYEKATHLHSYIDYPEEYTAEVKAFFAKHLRN